MRPRTGTCRHKSAPPPLSETMHPATEKGRNRKKFMPVYCLHVCVSKDMIVLDLGGGGLAVERTSRESIRRTPPSPPCRSHPVHYRWPELLAQLHGHIFNTEEEQHKPHRWVYAEPLHILRTNLKRYCIAVMWTRNKRPITK